MAQVSSRLIFVTLLLFYILLQSDLVRAMFYNVGDDKGWTFGVQDWPNFYKFEAGDILVFKYEKGSHNVAQLDKFGYDKCRVVESSAIFSSGNDHITLEKGLNYFICGIPGHCSSGLKISVSAS